MVPSMTAHQFAVAGCVEGNGDGPRLPTGRESPAKEPAAQVGRGESPDVMLPCTPTPARVAGADQPEETEVMAMSEDEEEVEQCRPPRTRKPPVGMTPEEMRTHSLTHIPFHSACRCCVAGRMRDHQHPRRSELQRMQDELDAANAHVSADYFFPKDAPGHKGVTALAVKDRATKFLAGHVVEAKRGWTAERGQPSAQRS